MPFMSRERHARKTRLMLISAICALSKLKSQNTQNRRGVTRLSRDHAITGPRDDISRDENSRDDISRDDLLLSEDAVAVAARVDGVLAVVNAWWFGWWD